MNVTRWNHIEDYAEAERMLQIKRVERMFLIFVFVVSFSVAVWVAVNT